MRFWSAVTNMIGFGRLGPVDDTGPVQTAQVSLGYMETQDARTVVQQFGLASNPPTGSDLVLIFQGGDRSKGVVIGSNHQATRPTGQVPGETTIFNAFGMSIYVSKNGIAINANGKPLTIQASNCTLDAAGNLTVWGNVTWNNGSTATHAATHEHPTAAVGAPSAPIPGT